MPSLTLFNDAPAIWAHRGGRSLAAENTLRALRMGRSAGARGCEIDVQLTRDAQVIVLHDLNLLRTTNAGAHPRFASGPPALPWLHTLEDIRALCADVFPRRTCTGSRHHKPWRELPDPCPEDVRVPTLAQALRLTRQLDMWLNVEIKDLARAAPPELAGRVVERVLEEVAAEGMEDRVIVSSFSATCVLRSKEAAPGVLAALLTPHGFRGDVERALRAVRADAWHPGHRGLERDAVRAALAAGYGVNPYTVNDAADMLRLAEWGVTGIVTDRPQDAPRFAARPKS
ncbi:Glycerophosphodiester phosphodiesterase [Fundidesulfovibrio magnetotacticus]|uniref:Glycerophosphodiester phosphodiesterase n=1 Tax=Fundidesulfovibrio magnetotacticus TaxID=2730080 RepID=A0A6V8LW24_9BACT|nr:glycerophosphodiester phosphodiesterase family protein [Fundidesulfovibrio magnetotacticus]GFK93867.1 Glycerophosphodiester phosphodiesterase [Fundidesulfovibrio magnetotacticus]